MITNHTFLDPRKSKGPPHNKYKQMVRLETYVLPKKLSLGGYVMSAGPYGLPGWVHHVCRAIWAPWVGTSCLPGHMVSLGGLMYGYDMAGNEVSPG